MNALRPLLKRAALGVGLAALGLGVAPTRAAAAVNIGTVRTAVIANSNTLDITNVDISGSNRYLLVGLCYGPEDTKSTVSVVLDPGGANQTSLSHLDNATAVFENDCQCQLWGTLAPPLGIFTVQATIVGALNPGEDLIGGVWPLSGVDQSDPRRPVVTNAANGDPTVTVGSAAGEIVFGAVFMEDATQMQIQAPGVEDWEINVGHPQRINDAGAGAHRAGAASVLLDWNAVALGGGSTDKFAAVGVSIKPSRAIAYSVGTNTGDLKSGLPTLGIVGGLATFSLPQPDNVGVGDEVIYNGGTRAFISGRVSSTVYQLGTVTGGTPPNIGPGIVVNSIKRAFNSLKAAATGSMGASFLNTSDLVVGNYQLNWPCYNDGPDPSVEIDIVEPWITGPQNYIRAYTPTRTDEVGVSQRHKGVAGTGYRIAPNVVTGATNFRMIRISNDTGYVRIEGLELDGRGISGAQGLYGLDIGDSDGTASDDIRISHNLIHGLANSDTATTLDVAGINAFVGNPPGTTRVWNNVVYDVVNVANASAADAMGIRFSSPAGTSVYYVYNNTVFDIRKVGTGGDAHGIEDNGISLVHVKNNYVGNVRHLQGGQQRCFNGTFASSNNNVSSDATASGAGSQVNRSAYASYFRSATPGSQDFHLVNDSFTLWGSSGADLDADPNLPVTDDFDGTARHATTPDIGADEQSGSTHYRSVGVNPANLNTFPRTVQIAGSTATFSGPLPDNVGVGDVLSYVSTGSRLAFIAARLSSTQFVVWDKDGATPTAAAAGTAVGVYRAYNRLADWENGIENPNIVEPVENDVNPAPNLVASGAVMMVACYADGEDVGSVYIDSWETGPSNYIRIYTPVSFSEVGASQRHNGAWDTSAYRLSQDASYFAVIGVRERYVRIDGLQLNTNQIVSTESNGIHAGNSNGDLPVEIHFSNNIVRSTTAALPNVAFGIGLLSSFGTTTMDSSLYVAKVWNNVVYGYVGSSSSTGIYAAQYGTLYAYNNTVVGTGAATHRGIAQFNNTVVHAKNNISIDSADPYAGSYHAASTHNVSDTGDAPPANARNCEPAFVNMAGADYHLSGTDTCARDLGTDLSADASLPVTFDIDQALRTVPWDIGADDLSATTAVRLQSFVAVPADAAVMLEWRTASELDNLGFHVYRSLGEAGPWQRLTTTLVPGLGSSPVGASYSLRDGGLANGTRYFYRLEDVDTASLSTFHGPVSAVPLAGLDDEAGEQDGSSSGLEGPGSGTSRCGTAARPCVETYGDPSANSLRVLSRGAGHAVVELVTGGFQVVRDAAGRVRVVIPGFEEPSDPRAAALPHKRVLLDAAVGRGARIVSSRGFDLVRYRDLVPAAVGHAEMDIRPDGTVRAGRRAASLRGAKRGYLPEELVRSAGIAFQGEQKSFALEISPLRYDVSRSQLVLARRVRVRVEFVGREASESGAGSRGRRRPQPRAARAESRDTLAFLHATGVGLQAVAFEALGLGRAVPTAELRLERQGEAVAFHAEPATDRFGPGSVLYFYAAAAAPSTAFSGEVAYELARSRDGGVRMSARSAAPLGPAVRSASTRTATFETNRIFQSGLLDAEDLWLWEHFVGGVAKTIGFTLAGVEPAAPALLTLHVQGGSDAEGVEDHHLRVYLGAAGARVLLGEARFDGKRPARLELAVPPSLLREGANELTIENAGDTGVYSLVFLDRFELEHAQTSLLRQGRFEGRWADDGVAEVAAERQRLLALDLSEPASPAWLTGLEAGPVSARLRVTAGRRLLLVSPAAVPAPRVQAPSRSSLRSARNQADYVVIAPEALLPAAAPLVARREAQGLVARAVSFEEVSEAFGHGQPSAEAIRSFLAHAFHEWQAPSLRYVLLLGDASHDPQNHVGTSARPPLPAAWLRTSYLWTASDPSLAALNGEDSLPDIAIGRLPAATLEQAHALVSKVLAWEDSGQGLSGAALLVADNPDLAGDFEADVDDVRQSFLGDRPTTTLRIRELGAATRPAILEALDAGTSLVSYVGHGGSAAWASENVLNSWDVPALRAQSQQPFMLTMNCLNGYFVAPNFDSLAEAFLKAEGRGTIGAFSPSGLSLDAPAHQLHRALLGELTRGGHVRLGDAILAAQTVYAASGEMPELLSIYHLLGDPATSLR